MIPYPYAGSRKDWFVPPTQEWVVLREQEKKLADAKQGLNLKCFYKTQGINNLNLLQTVAASGIPVLYKLLLVKKGSFFLTVVEQ